MLCTGTGLRKADSTDEPLITLYLTFNISPPHCKLNGLFLALPAQRIDHRHLNLFIQGNFCCGPYPHAPCSPPSSLSLSFSSLNKPTTLGYVLWFSNLHLILAVHSGLPPACLSPCARGCSNYTARPSWGITSHQHSLRCLTSYEEHPSTSCPGQLVVHHNVGILLYCLIRYHLLCFLFCICACDVSVQSFTHIHLSVTAFLFFIMFKQVIQFIKVTESKPCPQISSSSLNFGMIWKLCEHCLHSKAWMMRNAEPNQNQGSLG